MRIMHNHWMVLEERGDVGARDRPIQVFDFYINYADALERATNYVETVHEAFLDNEDFVVRVYIVPVATVIDNLPEEDE